MRTVLMIVTALHVLAGVYWAGSTFAAHGVAVRAERLAYSQLGAAFVAVLAGGALWGLTQPYGTARTILSLGAGCAIVALGIQATALPAVRQVKAASSTDAAALRKWIILSQRIAAGLLAVTVVCMVIWRYA